MRISAILLSIVLAAAAGDTAAQGGLPGSGTDLELTGRVLGPLPMQPGVETTVEFVMRNLGPRDIQQGIVVWATWPNDGTALLPVFVQELPCNPIVDIDGDPLPAYSLGVQWIAPLPVGATASCRLRLTVARAIPANASITFFAYQEFNLNPGIDPLLFNNTVTFQLGPIASVPSTSTEAQLLMILAVALAAALALRGAVNPRERLR